MNRLLLASAALALTRCSCGPGDDVSDLLTISQGVYGTLSTGCDTVPCLGGGSTGTPVSLSVGPDGGTVASTSTQARGFYELAADAGSYRLCAYGGGVCTSITIPVGLIRADHTSGPGGGVWRFRDGG